MPCDCHRLLQQFRQAEADRKPVEGIWDKLEKFISPNGGGKRYSSGESEASAKWTDADVWDVTASTGAETLAASIHGAVTSPAIRWAQLVSNVKALADSRVSQQFYEDLSDVLFDAIQDSDFNTEVGSADLDLVVFGNTFVSCEAKPDEHGRWGGFDFSGIALREGFFTEKSDGMIDTFWRRLLWTDRMIVDHFTARGQETLIPEQVKERALLPIQERREIIFCIFPRRDVPASPADEDGKPAVRAPHLRPFGCVYFLDTGEQVGEEGGYYEMPVFIVRWQRTPGSIWGHGPGHLALPTVMWLNGLCELDKLALEQGIDPPMLISEHGILSDPDITPGGKTLCTDIDKAMKPMPSDGGARRSADVAIAEARAMIRSIFHVDDLQLKDSPSMTATEAQIRYELMNRLLGSTLARIQSDFLDPLIHLMVSVLWREGRVPPVPPEIRKAGGRYTVEYRGPLSRAQRTDEVAAIERFASFVAALAKLGFMEAAENFDPVGAMRSVSKRLGCPAEVMVGRAEAEKKTKQRLALQQQMQEAEAQRAQGEAIAQAGVAGQEMGAAQQSMPARPPPVIAPTFPE